MDNLLQLAMQIILCLLIAAIIGAIIGYLLGKMSKCDKEEDQEAILEARKKTLNSYENESDSESAMLATTAATAKGRLKEETARLSDKEKESLSLVSEELQHTEEETTEEMQAFQKNLEGIEGERPSMLSAPRNGLPDDLKEISGIGLKIEEALNELGIFHFDQIAKWTPENVKWIDNYLVFKGRVERENWIGQAKLLAVGGSTDFSRKQKK